MRKEDNSKDKISGNGRGRHDDLIFYNILFNEAPAERMCNYWEQFLLEREKMVRDDMYTTIERYTDQKVEPYTRNFSRFEYLGFLAYID